MATDRTGYIEVADVNSVVFTDSKKDDFIIYTETSNQSILIGAQLSNVSAMAIRSNNVHITNRVNIGGGSNIPAVSLEVNTTDSLLLPKGTTGQRPGVPVQGYVRYNTSINTFEGFGAGNAWGSLGGVKDTNQDTYISAESYPTSNDDNLVFYNSNIEKMRITQQGFVGINTSNPSYMLHVNGQGYFESDATFNANLYINQKMRMQGVLISKNTNFGPTIYPTTPAANGVIPYYDNTVSKYTSSNSFLYNNGKLGINQTVPAYALDVAGTINATCSQGGVSIQGANSTLSNGQSINSVFGYSATDSNCGTIKYVHYGSGSSNYAQFGVWGRNNITCTANGNVGINNVTPNETFDVQGNTKISGNLYALNRIGVANNNPDEALDILGNIKVSSNIYAMNYLGVGTSNPVYPLDVTGDLNFTGLLRKNGAPYIGSQWSNNSTNVFLLSSNIGIGNSNPAYPLDVTGNVRASSNIYAGANVAIGMIAPSYPLDVLGDVRATGNIYAGSRIGIGNSNPAYPLDVNGNINCSGNISAGNLGIFRNRIINGDIRIDQKGSATTAVTVSSATGLVYITDRWFCWTNRYTNFGLTSQQVTDAPSSQGLKYSIKYTTTATISGGTTSFLLGGQCIEGYNIADFMWGTAQSVFCTLSFWVKSSRTGTFTLCIETSGEASQYMTTYTVTTANTWQYITLTVPPNTSDVSNSTNGQGAWIHLLCQGTYTAANAGWRYSVTPTWSYTTTGAISPLQASGDTIQFTGVQLEKGTMATQFEFRPYAIELQLCQRYYIMCKNPGTFGRFGFTLCVDTTSYSFGFFPLACQLRNPPTSTITTSGFVLRTSGGTNMTITSIISEATVTNLCLPFTIQTNPMTTGTMGYFQANTSNSYIAINNEL